MNYNVFVKKDEKVLSIIDTLIVVLLMVGLIIIVLGFIELFKIVTIFNLMLFIIKIFIVQRDKIKNSDKIIIDKPIVIDNKNIYLLQDKSNMLMMIIGVCCVFMYFLFDLSGDMLYYFLITVGIIFLEASDFFKKSNIKFLENNKNNLYIIINNKNMKYSINKVEKLTKIANGTYILTYNNSISKEVIFTQKYENYDELVNILNQRCS